MERKKEMDNTKALLKKLKPLRFGQNDIFISKIGEGNIFFSFYKVLIKTSNDKFYTIPDLQEFSGEKELIQVVNKKNKKYYISNLGYLKTSLAKKLSNKHYLTGRNLIKLQRQCDYAIKQNIENKKFFDKIVKEQQTQFEQWYNEEFLK